MSKRGEAQEQAVSARLKEYLLDPKPIVAALVVALVVIVLVRKRWDAHDIVRLVKAVVWPITAVGIVFWLRNPLKALLSRLSEALTIKSIKLKMFGSEVELSVEKVEGIRNDLIKEIYEPTIKLSTSFAGLFQVILSAGGQKTVEQIFPGFTREKKQATQANQERRPSTPAAPAMALIAT